MSKPMPSTFCQSLEKMSLYMRLFSFCKNKNIVTYIKKIGHLYSLQLTNYLLCKLRDRHENVHVFGVFTMLLIVMMNKRLAVLIPSFPPTLSI